MAKPLHDFVMLPDRATLNEVLPQFAGVKYEVHLGEPNQACAGCRKPFTVARKPRKVLRAYAVQQTLPLCISVRICGACLALFRQGGAVRDGVLAAVQAFIEGEEASA